MKLLVALLDAVLLLGPCWLVVHGHADVAIGAWVLVLAVVLRGSRS